MPDVDNPGTIQWRLNNLANHINNQFGDHPNANICREAALVIDGYEQEIADLEQELVARASATTKKVTAK